MSEEGSYNQGGWRWQDARGCCWDVRDCVRGAWGEYGPWWARSWRAGAATFADERIREKAGGFGPRRLPGRLQAGEGDGTGCTGRIPAGGGASSSTKSILVLTLLRRKTGGGEGEWT